MDKDRDTTIRGADIFDVAHWPDRALCHAQRHQDRRRDIRPSAR
jgi:hypothetical protein